MAGDGRADSPFAAVVFATPARATAAIVADVAPDAAALLQWLWRCEAKLPDVRRQVLSGVLQPACEVSTRRLVHRRRLGMVSGLGVEHVEDLLLRRRLADAE